MSNLGHTEKQFSGKEGTSQKYMSWSNGSIIICEQIQKELTSSPKTEEKLESCFMTSLPKEGLAVLWVCDLLTRACSDCIPQGIVSSSMSPFQHRREKEDLRMLLYLFLSPTKLRRKSHISNP